MAFVYRNENIQHQGRAQTPGPGQYRTKEHDLPTNSATGFFNKSVRKLWETSATPGPGDYNIQKENVDGEKIIYSNAGANFKVTNALFSRTGGCDSTFKSKSKRMSVQQSFTPGPGQEEFCKEHSEIVEINHKNESRGSTVHRPTKLTKYLYNEIRKMGQGLKSSEKEEENKNIEFGKSYENKENIGTNKQEIKKNNYSSIFNSKVERQMNSRPQTSLGIGPGSYNIAESYTNINKKSHHCKPKESKPEIIKNDSKFIEAGPSSEVGPGYYSVEKSSVVRPQTSFSRGIPCFGSKESRFGNIKSFNRKIEDSPGPQQYFKLHKSSKNFEGEKEQKRKPAFNSSVPNSHDFTTLITSEKFTEVSPFSYHPKNDVNIETIEFNELLKKNYSKGTIGRFGSTVERFKEVEITEEYEQKNSEKRIKSRQEIKEKNCTSIKQTKRLDPAFQSGRKEKIEESDIRPFCYDTYSKTIGLKFERKEQMEAPFMTASERFASVPFDYQQELQEALKREQSKISVIKCGNKQKKIYKGRPTETIQNKFAGMLKQTKKMDNFFDRSEGEEAMIGPQTYKNTLLPKKQTYNVLFKDRN